MKTKITSLHEYARFELLASNYKLAKLDGQEYSITGLTLAPHSLGGTDVCSSATPACRAACVLWFTGRTVTRIVRAAMLRRKSYFLEYRSEFEAQLHAEIEAHELAAIAAGLIPVVRLNVASDLDWTHIAEAHPETRFYDYTKVFSRIERIANSDWPSNYELTYSYNERTTLAQMNFCRINGVNVAMVFNSRYWPRGGRIDPLPGQWQLGDGLVDIVDGNVHDVRLHDQDGHGQVVGLRFRGSMRKRDIATRQGFVLDESHRPNDYLLFSPIVSAHWQTDSRHYINNN